jgi:hypothetical protein
MRSHVNRIAIFGLVALAAVLGGAAAPATAMAQPTSGVRPGGAVSATGVSTVAGVAGVAGVTAGAAMRAGAEAADAESGGGSPNISCVLATDCLAVRGSSSLSGVGTYTPTRVERWNGSSWERVGVILPARTTSVDLNGVSCRGARFCLVVGDYYKSTEGSSPSSPLALIYNGTSAKPSSAMPLPKGQPNVTLSGVSCATTRNCVAVGLANGNPAGLNQYSDGISFIETWNGARWTLHTIASSARTVVAPSAVSCATSSFCVLMGEATSISDGYVTVGLYLGWWNGGRLTRMGAAATGGAASMVEPSGVSCATPANCAVDGIVVGDAGGGSTLSIKGFTQVWNGRAWQSARTTWPKGVAESFLWDVSCYGAHSCEAVGFDAAQTDSPPTYAAAVSYRGDTGQVQAVPKPSRGRSTSFAAVSCAPSGGCVAIGDTGKNTAVSPTLMTGVWNGRTWRLEPGF